ncbi:MAG: hypothetical protein U9Q15_03810 [Patescibacteria group bacterium]|nr:hypothetical protein [Patescibacteria group bacterium]
MSELGVVAEKDIESAIDTPEELSIEEEINIVERETVKQLFEILMDAAQNPAQMDTHLDITQRDLNAMVDGTLDPSKFPVENENELIQTLFSMGE